jgi:hypothetical protein
MVLLVGVVALAVGRALGRLFDALLGMLVNLWTATAETLIHTPSSEKHHR